MAKKTKQIYFGEEKLERFEHYCNRSGRNMSALTVRAIEEYIARNPLK